MMRLKGTVLFCQGGLWGDEPDGQNDIICVRVADFDRLQRRVALEHPTVRAVPVSARAGRLLAPGDLLVEKSGGGERQPVGTVVLFDAPVEAICSNFVARMPVARGNDPSYLCYLHEALYTLGVTNRSIKQTTGIQNLDSESYLDEDVEIPPLEEQRTIAAFLRRKTQLMDSLIARKEKFLDLLEQKRRAAITQAVSEGLSSHPMKESGVEGIGRIPTHWEVHQLRRVVDEFVDYRGRTPVKVDEGIPLVTAGAVRNGRVDHARAPEFVTEADYREFMKRGLPRVGDLLFTTEAPLGEVALIQDENVALAQRIILFRVNKSRILSEFLWLYYRSDTGRAAVAARASGSTAEGIRADRLRGSFVIVPPLVEQHQIVREIRPRLAEIETIGRAVVSQCERLREYRQALISAAVTGKIDLSSMEAA